MSEPSKATKVVDQMYNNDPFSKWLGIERVEDGAGVSVLRMAVKQEMLNGFSVAHGGITYSLADSALAFASNGHGIQSLSIDTSISHTKKVVEGDVLTASAKELGFAEGSPLHRPSDTCSRQQLHTCKRLDGAFATL